MHETIKAYRVTFLVDEDTFAYLAKSHEYSEGNEVFRWENTEDVDLPMVYCDDCGEIVDEERENTSGNPDKCIDCDVCEDCGDVLNDTNRAHNLELCHECYKDINEDL